MRRVSIGRNSIIATAVIGIGVILSVVNRFVQDDAYISFRYAKNLARGLGLVWNADEKIEGYTNFLWTVLMAPAALFDIDMVVWSWIFSVVSFVLTLFLTWRWGVGSSSPRIGLLATGLLATNYSITSYATGGLETAFVTAQVMAAAYLLGVRRRPGIVRLSLAAIFSATAVMTRMDASLPLIPFWAAIVFPLKGRRPTFDARAFMLGLAIGGGIVGTWLLWRHAYYGYWLPNTFLIKGSTSPLRGFLYVSLFAVVYGWGILALKRLTLKPEEDERILCGRLPMMWACGLYLAYIVSVGGCFMEFRMLMAVLPFIALLIGEWIDAMILRRPKRGYALYAVLIALGLIGIPRRFPDRMITTVPELGRLAVEWRGYAEEWNLLFGDDASKIKLSLTPAGVIPYLTDAPSYDQLGLNQREVALEGDRIRPVHKCLGNFPGHVRLATWKQLTDAKVNLVLNHPWVIDRCALEKSTLLKGPAVSRVRLNREFPFFSSQIPPASGAKVVIWPISGNRHWVMIYLTPSKAVDDAIIRTGAIILPLTELNCP
jgi:arabinofuranosyltransferase